MLKTMCMFYQETEYSMVWSSMCLSRCTSTNDYRMIDDCSHQRPSFQMFRPTRFLHGVRSLSGQGCLYHPLLLPRALLSFENPRERMMGAFPTLTSLSQVFYFLSHKTAIFQIPQPCNKETRKLSHYVV